MRDAADAQSWFDEMYTATVPIVYRYVKSIYKTFPWLPDSIDDTVQEVFLCLYENRKKIYDESGLDRWLIKVAKNKTFEQFRKYRNHISIFNDFAAADIENLHNQYAGSVHDDFQEYIKLCENKIGKENFEKLQAYYLDQCSIEKLAQEDNVSVETMHVRMHRWRRRCSSVLRKAIRLNLLIAIVFLFIEK